MAAAVDPLNSLGAAARLLDGAIAGISLARDGSTQPLPGLPSHPVLATASRLLSVAVNQLKGASHTSFLCPYDSAGSTDHLHITVLAGSRLPPSYVTAALVVSHPQDLRRLTRRELQVLGLVIDGYSNRQIAKTLWLTDGTVNTHLEHIRAKLDTPSRTLAAVRALRQASTSRTRSPLVTHPDLTPGRRRRTPDHNRPAAACSAAPCRPVKVLAFRSIPARPRGPLGVRRCRPDDAALPSHAGATPATVRSPGRSEASPAVAVQPIRKRVVVAETGSNARRTRATPIGPARASSANNQPEEIAPAFLFFASNADSSYVTGETLALFGGRVLAR